MRENYRIDQLIVYKDLALSQCCASVSDAAILLWQRWTNGLLAMMAEYYICGENSKPCRLVMTTAKCRRPHVPPPPTPPTQPYCSAGGKFAIGAATTARSNSSKTDQEKQQQQSYCNSDWDKKSSRCNNNDWDKRSEQ